MWFWMKRLLITFIPPRQSIANLILNLCTQVNIVWFLGAAGFCHVEASDYTGDWSSVGVDGSVVVRYRINSQNEGQPSATNIANFGFEVNELSRFPTKLLLSFILVSGLNKSIVVPIQRNLTIRKVSDACQLTPSFPSSVLNKHVFTLRFIHQFDSGQHSWQSKKGQFVCPMPLDLKTPWGVSRTVTVPFSSCSQSWRGQPQGGRPSLQQLKSIRNVGFITGSWDNGKESGYIFWAFF